MIKSLSGPNVPSSRADGPDKNPFPGPEGVEHLRAHGVWTPPYRTRLDDARGHRIEVDLDRPDGGSDVGTSSLELTVLSMAGCVSTIFALVAGRRRLRYSRLEVSLEADRPPRSPTITAVRGTVRVWSSAPEADVATAVNLTVRTCPVGVLFDRAGIPVELRTEVVPDEPDPRRAEMGEPVAAPV